jgi:hypothetical protein
MNCLAINKEGKMKKILLGLILFVGFMSTANADTLDWQGWGYGDSYIYVHYPGLGGSSSQYNPYFAGQILESLNGSSTFAAYCLSVLDLLNNSQTVTVNPLGPTGSGGQIAWLLNTYGSGVNSDIKGAALQLAIWEVLYDAGPSYNLSNGTFSVMSVPQDYADLFDLFQSSPLQPGYTSVIAEYTSAMDQINSEVSLATTYLNSIGSNTSQAYWLNTTNGQPVGAPSLGSQVPEPSSLVFLGTGLGMLGLGWRRRRK